ncbi:MAG: NAD(+)--dinitrogen-reductase ADP-D-ribosyltransferase [Magnetococcales bacterium]|nr:NAD(+)--dinitrogen-reductase ADP-D-ribosyltransferase [Magnetococcales bacterium]
MRQIQEDCKDHDNLETLRLDLPHNARSPFNRTRLGTVALGGIAFQRHPVPLELSGVRELHHGLFKRLAPLVTHQARAQQFMDYMTVYFLLQDPERVGYTEGSRLKRCKVDYQRILRGWLFNPDGREAAVLKGWVASRFGLLARYHGGALDDYEGAAYQHFLHMQSAGLYNTNALESQLDILYTYCQYELAQRLFGQSHWLLYRGVNAIDEHDVVARGKGGKAVVLLNNLNSFSEDRERAEEFGDYIMEVQVPLPKVLFYHGLLPGAFKGEGEVMVIGGYYVVNLATY